MKRRLFKYNAPDNGSVIFKNKKNIYLLAFFVSIIFIAIHYFLSKTYPNDFSIYIDAIFIASIFLFDFFTPEHLIPKTLTVPVFIYGVLIHIRHPLFFIAPALYGALTLFLFTMAHFGMGDVKAMFAISVLLPNTAFSFFYVFTFLWVAVINGFLLIKKRRVGELKKVFLAFAGVTEFDGAEGFIPFSIYIALGYITLIVVNFIYPVWR